MQPDDQADAVDAVTWAMWQDAKGQDPDPCFVWPLTLIDADRLADLYWRGPREPLAAALAALKSRGWHRTASRIEEAVAHREAQAAAQTIANARARR